MKKLVVSLIFVAAFLTTSNSYAGETCDAGYGCVANCAYGDWCVANYKLPDGPCVTRCPSKLAGVSSLSTQGQANQAEAGNMQSISARNAPASVLREMFPKSP